MAVLGCVWLALAASVGHAAPSEANGTCGDDDVTFFPNVAKIKYEGPDSRDPMSFRYYNADEEICVAGKGCKKMRDWLRFSVAFWHTFRGDGSDPFGSPTKLWPWDEGADEMQTARLRMKANFEFLDKLGVDYWCFHDRDIAPEADTLKVSKPLLPSFLPSFFSFDRTSRRLFSDSLLPSLSRKRTPTCLRLSSSPRS